MVRIGRYIFDFFSVDVCITSVSCTQKRGTDPRVKAWGIDKEVHVLQGMG